MKKQLLLTASILLAFFFKSNAQQGFSSFAAMQQFPNANYYTITHLLDSIYTANPDTAEDGTYASYQRWKLFYKDRVNFGTDSLNGSFNWIDKFSLNAMYNPPCVNQGSHSNYWNFAGPENNAIQQRGIVTAVAATHGLDTIYAAGRGTGLYRSLDYGSTWNNVTDYLKIPNLGIMDIVIDPKNSNTIYIATGNKSTYGVGLLKSTNGGNTWVATGLSFTPNLQIPTTKVIVHPVYNNMIYALTNDTIYKSWDYGVTFNPLYGGIKNTDTNYIIFVDRTFNDMAIDYSDTATVYVGTTGIHAQNKTTGNLVNGLAKMFKLQVAGGMVTPTFYALNDSADKVILATSLACPTRVMRFIFQLVSTPKFKLEKTYNKGLIWSTVSTVDPANFDYFKSHLLISSADSNIIYAGGIGQLGKSLNGGVTFTNYNSFLHVDKRKLFLINGSQGGSNDTLLVGTDGGLVVSFNGAASWSDISEGMQLSEYHGFDLSPTADESISGGCQDIGFKSLFNLNWKVHIGVGDGYETVYLKRHPNFIYGYAGGQSSAFYKSSNNGLTFSSTTNIPTTNYTVVAPLFVDNRDSIYAARHELYRSKTPTLSWTKISNFAPFSITSCLPADKQIRAFSISTKTPAVIYVAFDGGSSDRDPCTGNYWGTTTRKNVFYQSVNGGTTWIDLTNNLTQTVWDNVTAIVTDQNNSNKLWVSFSGFDAVGQNHIFMSTDRGITFTDYSQGLPEFPVNCLIQQNNTGKCALYAGTDAGVFYRDSTMSAWECYNNSMPRTHVTDLAIDYCLGRVYAATYGRGIWYSNLAVTSSGNVSINTPIIVGDSFACKSSGIYSVSNPQAGIFYSWATTSNDNSAAQYGSGTTATITLNDTAQTTLTFYAIDTNAWSACNSSVGMFQIIACCGAGIAARNWSGKTAQWLKTQSLNAVPGYQYLTAGNPNVVLGNSLGCTSNCSFAINDSFVVDINLKISQADIILGPNAKIIVKPGIKLEITGGTHLHTCNSEYMWDGIYLMDNAKLDASDNAVFEEAINAVVTYGSARVTTLDSVYFLQNRVHIKMNPCNVVNASSIRQTWFDCSDATGTVKSLIKPYEAQYTYACFLMDSVKSIVIGDSSNSNATNYFKNAQYGITATRSAMSVYNNLFKFIAGNLLGNIYYPSDAIFVNGDTTSRKVDIGSVNIVGRNYFDRCDNGIVLQSKVGGKIENNKFDRMATYGISVYDPGNYNLNITRNTLRSFLTGIIVYDFYKAGAKITSNILRAGDPRSFTSFNATCIYAANTGSKGTPNLYIDNNSIDSSRVGIYVLNAKKPRIRTNSIIFRANADALNGYQFTGIYLGGCNGDSIMQNIITNVGSIANQPTNYEDLHRAINIQNSPNSYVYNNNISKFGTGVYFYSANQNGRLVCNNIINTHRGVYLDGANIGQQGSSNNPWDNNWIQSPVGIYRVASINTPLIPWFFQGLELNINNTFSPNPYSTNAVTPFELETGPNLCVVDSHSVVNPIEDYMDTVHYPEFANQNQLYDVMYVYDQLRLDSALRAATTDGEAFYSQWQNTAVSELATVEDYLTADDANNALTTLADITPQNDVESLAKQAYLFNINEHTLPNKLTTVQRMALQEHVYDLPKKYGEAIYRLRATLFEEVYDYPGTGRMANQAQASQSDRDYVSLANPNPTSDNVSFNLRLTVVTDIILTDIYGKVLLQSKVNPDVDLINLSLLTFQTGVYFITFKQNNLSISNAKVVLIK